mgnify:CR=1 FL=1
MIRGGKMDGFERRKKQKQTAILKASLKLFMKNGIKKVSIQMIAKEADVSQVTIYNYFGSKDQLVDEVIAYYVNNLWVEYEEIIYSKQLSYKEKLEQVTFQKNRDALHIHEEVYERMMNDFNQNRGALKDYQDKAMPLLMDLLNEGKELGYIDKNISNEAIMIFSQMFINYIQKEEVHQYLLPYTEDLMQLFFYGIFGKEKD